ncbi:MAG: hypothetical protein OXB92_16600, partial [Acidimicrobiaceae bacterium]|nr:hypothetical protein [Acidimicrobiaceae bacterium]
KLVGNTVIGTTTEAVTDFEDLAYSQKFTTGTHRNGYALTSIVVDLSGSADATQLATFRAELWTNSSGNPGTRRAELTLPSSFTAGLNTFTAPAGTELEDRTEYHVVIYTTGDLSTAMVARGGADREDTRPRDNFGWSIANQSRQTAANVPTADSTWTANAHSLQIQVNGYNLVPTTLTLSTDASNNMASETAGTVSVTATLDQPAVTAVTLTLTETGSADIRDDFTLPAALTIRVGETAASGNLTIVNDDIDEDDETIILSASGAGSLTLTGGTLTINDNDDAGVTLSHTARAVEVGETTTYTAVLTSEPTAGVTLTPTSSVTARATVLPASLSFTSSNWNSPQSFTVTGVATGASTVSHAVSGSASEYPSSLTVQDVAVTVNASTKTFRIEASETLNEGQTTSLTVTLGRNAPSGGLSLSVAYGYSGSTATSADLNSPPSTVRVNAGSPTATLRVPTRNDALVEGDETFTATITTSVSGWAVVSGQGSATVTITDDDAAAATIGFGTAGRTTAHTASVAENVSGGMLNVPVQVSHNPQASITVAVEVR